MKKFVKQRLTQMNKTKKNVEKKNRIEWIMDWKRWVNVMRSRLKCEAEEVLMFTEHCRTLGAVSVCGIDAMSSPQTAGAGSGTGGRGTTTSAATPSFVVTDPVRVTDAVKLGKWPGSRRFDLC